MATLKVTPQAQQGLWRAINFLRQKDESAAMRLGKVIRSSWGRLERFPESAPIWEGTEYRRLHVPFGRSGYTTIYRYNAEADTIWVLAVQHDFEQTSMKRRSSLSDSPGA